MSGLISNPLARLSTITGASLIGFAGKAVGSVFRPLRDKAREHDSVEDFGEAGAGQDDTAVIQRAIDAAEGELWFTKKQYRVDGQLTWKNGVRYRGKGVRIFGMGGTKIVLNATDKDATRLANPINSSTPANVDFEGLYLHAPNLQPGKAALADTGSSYVTMRGCRVYSAGDCLHLDQSEMWDIEHSSFVPAGANSVGIWIVNGPDKQPGAIPYYSNRIGVRSCDFNGSATATGIYDDGGVAHAFENNNFNACGSHIIATGVNGLKVDGGEFEESSAQSIIIGLAKRKGGVGSKSATVSITRAYLYNTKSQPVLATVAGAIGELSFTGNVLSTNQGTAVTGLAVGCDEIDARGNVAIGSVVANADINNAIDVNPAAVGWTASVVSPTIGNGKIQGSYARRGKLVTFGQRVEFGSTTKPGTGRFIFPLAIPADPAVIARHGSGLLIVPGVSNYPLVARIADGGATVELFVYTSQSSLGADTYNLSWPAGSVIEFSINYVAKAAI